MSSGSSASFCLIVCFLVCSSEALEIITAEHGQDVTLTCKADNNNKPIRAVEWSRSGLNPPYVLLYRDGRFDPDVQNPSYKNRVDLKDREMKDGDVSLVLKNVKMEDRGRYECFVDQGEKYSTIINLVVLPPGAAHGDDEKRKTPNAGVIVGSVVVAGVGVAGIIIMIIRLRRRTMTSRNGFKRQTSELPVTYTEVDQHQSEHLYVY